MWLHVTLSTPNRWWSEGDIAYSSRLTETATSKNPIWHAGEQTDSELLHHQSLLHRVLLVLQSIMPHVSNIMNIASGDRLNKRQKQSSRLCYLHGHWRLIYSGDWIPVHHWGSSTCHHGPDPASRVEQGEFEAGTTLSIQVGDVRLLFEGGMMVWPQS